MTHVERRACQRFAVPEAKVVCTRRSRLPFRTAIERDGVLMDLSRGGVRFLITENLKKKTRVKLEIRVPGESSTLQVTGRVVWSWPHPGGVYQEVAVQFEPYGVPAGANSPEVLEAIAELERRFCQPCDRRAGWPLDQDELDMDPALFDPCAGEVAPSVSL